MRYRLRRSRPLRAVTFRSQCRPHRRPLSAATVYGVELPDPSEPIWTYEFGPLGPNWTLETEKREKGEKRETYLKVTFEVVLVSRKSKGRALHWLKLKSSTATTEQEHMSLLRDHRPCGLMDKALVFGTKDCRFESWAGHFPGCAAILVKSIRCQSGSNPAQASSRKTLQGWP